MSIGALRPEVLDFLKLDLRVVMDPVPDMSVEN